MGEEQRITFCRICEAHCGLEATVQDRQVTRLRLDRDHPLSSGYACPKGIAMLDVQNDPDRVVHPLRRRAGGEGFQPVSWEEAIADAPEQWWSLLAPVWPDLDPRATAGTGHLEPGTGQPGAPA